MKGKKLYLKQPMVVEGTLNDTVIGSVSNNFVAIDKSLLTEVDYRQMVVSLIEAIEGGKDIDAKVLARSYAYSLEHEAVKIG
jgi:hypothetical protein